MAAAAKHLSLELFKLMTGTNLTHIPYRGRIAGLFRRHWPAARRQFFDTLSSALGQIKSGTVRALAVTGKERSASLCPTCRRSRKPLPGYQNYVWFGLWAPKKTRRRP